MKWENVVKFILAVIVWVLENFNVMFVSFLVGVVLTKFIDSKQFEDYLKKNPMEVKILQSSVQCEKMEVACNKAFEGRCKNGKAQK